MRFNKFVGLVLSVPLLIGGTTSCFARTAPEPSVSSLIVRNRSLLDVHVYSVTSAAVSAVALGTVAGTSSVTFVLHRQDLQPGGVLVVMLHAVGAWSSWTSDTVTLGNGVIAVLDVSTDSFGDCSTSSLHAVIAGEILSPPGDATSPPRGDAVR